MRIYTKRQIIEAITHWQGVLNALNESKSKLLSAFEHEFGTDAVYSKDLKIPVTSQTVRKIYDVLNGDFFGNALAEKPGKLDIYCGSSQHIASVLRDEFGAPADYDISDMLALFHPKLNWFRDKSGKLAVKSLRNGIFINLSFGKYATLAYLISTVCREMIHCYDCLNGHLLQFTTYCVQIGCEPDEISYESHFTPVFKEKSTQMKNENGISIRITGEGKSYDDLNREAAEEIQLMREGENLSGYEPVVFSEEFKRKNSWFMTFCDDGSVLLRFS